MSVVLLYRVQWINKTCGYILYTVYTVYILNILNIQSLRLYTQIHIKDTYFQQIPINLQVQIPPGHRPSPPRTIRGRPDVGNKCKSFAKQM